MPLYQTFINHLFDLEGYEHRSLFDQVEWPWEVLSLLESYLETLPLGQHLGTLSSQAYLIHPEKIYIGKGAIVEPGAYLQGPCYIGENTVIRHGAYIRENVITGKGCVLGHDTEIKNSLFFNQTNAAHFAYVGDSILGSNVNLGAGCKIANLRLDRQAVKIEINSIVYETGRRKMGAFIGDGTQIGCNSVLNPGTCLGKKTIVGPLTSLKGCVNL